MTLAERIAQQLGVQTDRYMFGLFGDEKSGAGGFGKLQILGKTKHVTRCQNCGRAGLKHAVVCAVVGEDGHPTNQYYYFGSDCASKLAGKAEKDIDAEAEEQEQAGRPRMKKLKPVKPNEGQMELGLRFAAQWHSLLVERYGRPKPAKGQMGLDFDALSSSAQPTPQPQEAIPAVTAQQPAAAPKGRQMGLFEQPAAAETVSKPAGFEEQKHPRWEAGDKQHHGGQFAPKESKSEGVKQESAKPDSELFSDHFKNGRVGDAVALLQGKSLPEAIKIAGDFGLPVYNHKSKGELLRTVQQYAEANTPEKRQAREKKEKAESAYKTAKTAFDNAMANKNGLLGAPINFSGSDEQFRNPHAPENREAIQSAWREEVAKAFSELDPEHADSIRLKEDAAFHGLMPSAKPQEEPKPQYFKGDQIRLTGKADGDFEEFEYLEGHNKGQKGLRLSPAASEAQVKQKQQEWKDQQAQFGRLHQKQEEPKAAEGHEPYEHERYPGKWLVPSKAGVRGFGDTLHTSKDDAIAESHRVAGRLKSQQEATDKAESDRQAEAERKSAFKASGLTPAQAAIQGRVQAHLSQQVSAQGNITTRQALLDKELSEGHKPAVREVPDDAARVKAAKEADFMLKRGVPTGNESHPDTIKLRELQAKAKSAMKQEHVMEKGDGVYRPLSKMEHDYAAAKYQPKAEGKDDDYEFGWLPENHVKIAADSIQELRRGDVFRLFESAPQGRNDQLARYINKHRPDLSAEVHDALAELGEQPASPKPAPAAQPAESVTAAGGSLPAPEPQAAQSVGGRVAEAIAKRSMDFGRKVEVRKDRAKSTGPKAKKQVHEWDLDEGWARRYQITQVASSKDPSEVGKFIITDKKQKGPWYAKDQGVQVGGQYASAEEAKQALPLIEVTRNHRVYEGRDGKWHIYRKLGDRHHVSVKSFPSQEEAMKYMAMNPRGIIGHKFPRYETYQYLTEVERNGPDRRKGAVNEQDFQKAFAPGGAVFGNWMTNKDGVTAFHHAYDSLHDLSDVLGLHPHQVSIDGDLVFGFGAAGSGGKDAARAHYEPGQRLINLTKMAGAGSLAHEWWHALEHHIAKKLGASEHTAVNLRPSAMKNDPELAAAVEELHDAMHYSNDEGANKAELQRVAEAQERRKQKLADTNREARENGTTVYDPQTPEDFLHNIRLGMKQTLSYKKKEPKPELMKQYEEIESKLKAGDLGERAGFTTHGFMPIYANIQALSDLHKKITGRGLIAKDAEGDKWLRRIYWDNLKLEKPKTEAAKVESKPKRTVRSKFKIEADKLDHSRSSPYYGLPHEMAARAFESYVEDKLKEKGIQSDYLVGQGKTDSAFYKAFGLDAPFPEGEERKQINAAFDKLLAAVRKHLRQPETERHSLVESAEQLNRRVRQLVVEKFGANELLPEQPKPQQPTASPALAGQVDSHPHWETPEFKNWFGGSHVKTPEGKPLRVFHGTKRPDRVQNFFNPKRATSGPMSFFTDSPAIASSYASSKQDTSLEHPQDYGGWFKYRPPGRRSDVNIDQAWNHLPQQQRQSLLSNLPRVTHLDDEGNERPEGKGGFRLTDNDRGLPVGRQHWEHELKQARGNALQAAKEIWLNSGMLYGDEEKFLDVLKTAGMHGARFESPWAEYPSVYPVHLSIQNPLDTANIPDHVHGALQQAGKRKRGSVLEGADQWDKRSVRGQDWLDRLARDRQDGTAHAWTSIPDWVTKTLMSHGYDGIKDTGGKQGGEPHNVWIPFHPHQVKSAIGNRGTYSADNKRINFNSNAGVERYSAGNGFEELLARAAKYRQKGQGYNRNIHTSASRLDDMLSQGRHKEAAHWADELRLRLDAIEPQQPKPATNLFGEPVKPASKAPASFDAAKAKQGILFAGLNAKEGQMNLFADAGVPDDLVAKPQGPEQKELFSAIREAIVERYAAQQSPWFLRSSRVLAEKMGQHAPASQVLATLRNNQVSPEELKWTGLEKHLLGKGNQPVSQQELHDLIGQFNVGEKVLGDLGYSDKLRKFMAETGWRQDVDGPLYNYLYKMGTEANKAKLHDKAEEFLQLGNEAWEKRYADNEPKYASYALPGGQNYREMLLTLPQSGGPRAVKHPKHDGFAIQHPDGSYATPNGSFDPWLGGGDGGTTVSPENAAVWATESDARKYGIPFHDKNSHQSGHWDEPNVLAHVRYQDFTGPDGKKHLHIDEIQSDWHQQGRKQGYSQAKPKVGESITVTRSNNPVEAKVIADHNNGVLTVESKDGNKQFSITEKDWKRGVPDAPFKNNWHMLAMKRMMHHAAANGYDRVTWTPGEEHASRYDLSKHVSEINYRPGQSSSPITITGTGGQTILDGSVKNGVVHAASEFGHFHGKHLHEIVGKEVADKLASAPAHPETGIVKLAGDGLKVGGEGMKGFYDRMLPNDTNKLIKKHGGKVGQFDLHVHDQFHDSDGMPTSTETRAMKVHGFDVTPSMKAEATGGKGQSMFSVYEDADWRIERYAADGPKWIAIGKSAFKLGKYRVQKGDDNLWYHTLHHKNGLQSSSAIGFRSAEEAKQNALKQFEPPEMRQVTEGPAKGNWEIVPKQPQGTSLPVKSQAPEQKDLFSAVREALIERYGFFDGLQSMADNAAKKVGNIVERVDQAGKKLFGQTRSFPATNKPSQPKSKLAVRPSETGVKAGAPLIFNADHSMNGGESGFPKGTQGKLVGGHEDPSKVVVDVNGQHHAVPKSVVWHDTRHTDHKAVEKSQQEAQQAQAERAQKFANMTARQQAEAIPEGAEKAKRITGNFSSHDLQEGDIIHHGLPGLPPFGRVISVSADKSGNPDGKHVVIETAMRSKSAPDGIATTGQRATIPGHEKIGEAVASRSFPVQRMPDEAKPIGQRKQYQQFFAQAKSYGFDDDTAHNVAMDSWNQANPKPKSAESPKPAVKPAAAPAAASANPKPRHHVSNLQKGDVLSYLGGAEKGQRVRFVSRSDKPGHVIVNTPEKGNHELPVRSLGLYSSPVLTPFTKARAASLMQKNDGMQPQEAIRQARLERGNRRAPDVHQVPRSEFAQYRHGILAKDKQGNGFLLHGGKRYPLSPAEFDGNKLISDPVKIRERIHRDQVKSVAALNPNVVPPHVRDEYDHHWSKWTGNSPFAKSGAKASAAPAATAAEPAATTEPSPEGKKGSTLIGMPLNTPAGNAGVGRNTPAESRFGEWKGDSPVGKGGRILKGMNQNPQDESSILPSLPIQGMAINRPDGSPPEAAGQSAAASESQPAPQPPKRNLASITRPFNAGANRAMIQFDSELQRDLHDLAAARSFKLKHSGNVDGRQPKSQQALNAKLSQIANQHFGGDEDAASLAAMETLNHVKRHMKGVQDGEHRIVPPLGVEVPKPATPSSQPKQKLQASIGKAIAEARNSDAGGKHQLEHEILRSMPVNADAFPPDVLPQVVQMVKDHIGEFHAPRRMEAEKLAKAWENARGNMGIPKDLRTSKARQLIKQMRGGEIDASSKQLKGMDLIAAHLRQEFPNRFSNDPAVRDEQVMDFLTQDRPSIPQPHDFDLVNDFWLGLHPSYAEGLEAIANGAPFNREEWGELGRHMPPPDDWNDFNHFSASGDSIVDRFSAVWSTKEFFNGQGSYGKRSGFAANRSGKAKKGSA